MIPKQTFISAINSLMEQYYLDKANVEKVSSIFQSTDSSSYNNSLLVRTILDLLRLDFPRDSDGFCWIEHYCYQLGFGKWDESDVMTVEDLWDKVNTETDIQEGNFQDELIVSVRKKDLVDLYDFAYRQVLKTGELDELHELDRRLNG